jgi:hypothetical protein
MARKGDIDSKSVSSRVPMEVFLKLQKQAFDKKQTMSAYLCDILSKDSFGKGGETKIEYRDRIIEKEVPVEYHHDKVIKDPKLIQENTSLKEKIKLLEDEIKALKNPQKEPIKKYCRECNEYMSIYIEDGIECCDKCGSNKVYERNLQPRSK